MLDPHQLFGAIVALNALFASLAWFLARPSLPAMLSVLAFAILWPFVDKPLGGRTILIVDDENGVTTGDLLSVLAVAIVAFLLARQIIRARSRGAQARGDQARDALPASPQPPAA